jgi:HK97 family phage major capsid protein
MTTSSEASAATYELRLQKRLGVTTKRDENRDFSVFLRHGLEALPEEIRAQSIGTDSAGGYLVAQEFSDKLWSMLKAVDPLFDPEVVTRVETETGGPYVIPLHNDVASVAAIVAENAMATVADLGVFDQIVLPKCPTWRTALVKVSVELAQDSAFDFEELVANAFTVQLQRGIGASLVTTLLAGATAGATAGASTITADNVYDLIGSIDAAYLASSKVAWLMNRATLVAILKLADTAGMKIFPTAYDARGRQTLLGLPVYISPSMAGIGTGNKSVAFGDLSRLVVRVVADSFRVKRLEERFMESLMLAFLGYARINAALAKATGADAPVKYLAHS